MQLASLTKAGSLNRDATAAATATVNATADSTAAKKKSLNHFTKV